MEISTLVKDIYSTVKTNWMTDEIAADFSRNLTERLRFRFKEEKEEPRLRISKLGPRCPRALWYSIHKPEEAQPLQPWTEITFAYGDIVELQTLALAKAAGHSVIGEQDEVWADGVAGHRDCLIDGYVVDVKSCGRYGYKKFQDGTIAMDDLFGYLDQLDGYLLAGLSDPLVRFKDTAYILAVDKQLGHMCLYEHKFREQSIRDRISEYKSIVERSSPPACECKSIHHQSSGNLKLDIQGAYNVFKYACNPEIRTFLYKEGPVYLTKVVRKPDVIEIDRYGNRV